MRKLLGFGLLTLAGIALACSDTIEMRIPVRPVNLELDLTYQDKALNAIQGWKIYRQKDVDQAGEYTGFGGVLVYHGLNTTGSDSFYAFDAACPYEASSSVTIEVDESAVYGVCPQCGSKFELLNVIGNPVEGPAAQERFQLKHYQTERVSNILHIYN